MRALVYSALIGDATLNSLGITGASSFAVDVDTPQSRPFMQLRWGRNDVGLSVVTRRTLVIWVHDKPSDYVSKIDPVIARLKIILPELVGESNGAGHLVDAEWLGDSEDLIDDGHKTIARNSSWLLVGSGQ